MLAEDAQPTWHCPKDPQHSPKTPGTLQLTAFRLLPGSARGVRLGTLPPEALADLLGDMGLADHDLWPWLAARGATRAGADDPWAGCADSCGEACMIEAGGLMRFQAVR